MRPDDRPAPADLWLSYTKHWHADSTQDDQSRTNSRLDKYTDVVKCVSAALPFADLRSGYYDGATEARSRRADRR